MTSRMSLIERIERLEDERTNLVERVHDQRATILMLAGQLGKALSERDKARDLACAMEAEGDNYGMSLLGPAGYEPRG
jgi:predicted Zn-dependent protease